MTYDVTDPVSLAAALTALSARVSDHDALFLAIAATCREDADARRVFDKVLDRVEGWSPESPIVPILRETLARMDQPSAGQCHH